jgi:hypothetical protein
MAALSALTSLSNPEVVTLARQRFLPFLEQANALIRSLTDTFRIISSLLTDTASLFGESVKLTQGPGGGGAAPPSEDPGQKFFQMLSQITTQYRKADEEMKQWLIEESKRISLKSQPSQDNETSNSSGPSAQDESNEKRLLEDLRKKDTDENLFGRFRNQQEASADDMISQLKAKMKLKKRSD